MPKTMTLEEFTHATGQDLLNDAHAYGDVVVKNEAGREVGVFHVKQRSVEDVLQDVRKEWDDRLAVLNEPGSSEEMLEIFHSTPEEFAEAANAAEAERRRRG